MDILPPSQRQLWPQLQGSVGLGFTLYGGTAIALRLGHRTSVDFDFFSPRPLDRVAMRNAFPFLAKSTVLQDQANALTGWLTENAAWSTLPARYVTCLASS